jgi:hypothetical protein
VQGLASVRRERHAVRQWNVRHGQHGAGLIQIAEAEIVEQRAAAAEALDPAMGDPDAVIGLELDLRLAGDDAVEQV